MDRQCSSCGGICKKSGCERENMKPEPEPVAVWELQEDGWNTIADPDWMETLPVGTKLYIAPPKREWVGLTDEEINAIGLANGFGRGSIRLRQVINTVGAKLKEKND